VKKGPFGDVGNVRRQKMEKRKIIEKEMGENHLTTVGKKRTGEI